MLSLSVPPVGFSLTGDCTGRIDTTIVATAIPRITDHFKALDDGTPAFPFHVIKKYTRNDAIWRDGMEVHTCSPFAGFSLRLANFIPIFSIKSVFLVAIGSFELGSLNINNSDNRPGHRRSTTLGCAGIFSGALIVIAHSVPLHRRPAYTGLIGAMYGNASIAGWYFSLARQWRCPLVSCLN